MTEIQGYDCFANDENHCLRGPECKLYEACCSHAGLVPEHAITITVETPGYSCFAHSRPNWNAAMDSPCQICDLYGICNQTYIDKKGVIAILEEYQYPDQIRGIKRPEIFEEKPTADWITFLEITNDIAHAILIEFEGEL